MTEKLFDPNRWDRTSTRDREKALKGSLLGSSLVTEHEGIRPQAEQPEGRGEDYSATLSRIKGRWLDHDHDRALAEDRRRPQKSSIKPIRGFGEGRKG